MNLDKLLHVLWDARDFIEEWGMGEKLDMDLIKRIEAEMNVVEQIIWERENA